ncbi:MAG TPA: hypothetical protein PLC42_03860 [Parachlamydiaceae bacterium]|nr:hypothetical protein [Parachlamydiaceae bacterium]
MLFFLTVYAFSLVGFFIHLFLSKKDRNKKEIFELLMLYQLVVNIGILSLIAAFALLFMPQMVADSLNWPTCPFQHELGNVNLAFGVLGILCIWFRNGFWTATIIGASIWLLGDGIGHLILMKNQLEGTLFSFNNWAMMITDFLIPLTLLLLLFAYRRLEANKT